MTQKQAASRGTWGRQVVTALTVVVFAICSMMLMGAQRSAATSLPLVLLIIPLTFVVVIIHELGHVLAAATSGVTVLGMSIGPIWILRRRRGVQVRLIWLRRNAAGSALGVPDPARDVRRQMLQYIAGGPLANLLVAALVLTTYAPAFASRPNSFDIFALVFGLLNLHTGIANLIPFSGQLSSDGWQLRQWWRGDVLTHVSTKILAIYHYSAAGISASELPKRAIEELQENESVGVSFFGNYLALRAAQQHKDWCAFDGILAQCEETLGKLDTPTYTSIRLLWAFMLIEKAFEQACRADTSLVDIDPSLLKVAPAYLRLRLLAARACIENDRAEFSRLLNAARLDVAGVFDAATRKEEPPLLARLVQAFDNTTSPMNRSVS